MSPLLRKNGAFRLYPNRLIYLFLAVFAFSSPFCYAKTAFSYSRTLLSPCTPVPFMVKDVVKSERRMIAMWSWFRGGRSVRSLLRRQKRIMPITKKKYTNHHMWSTVRKEMINMWSEQSDSQEQRTPLSFFRRCCIVTLMKGFVKPFSRFVCYSSVARDELNAIYRIRNSGMQVRSAIKLTLKFDTQQAKKKLVAIISIM